MRIARPSAGYPEQFARLIELPIPASRRSPTPAQRVMFTVIQLENLGELKPMIADLHSDPSLHAVV
jgi:hypothetical protein